MDDHPAAFTDGPDDSDLANCQYCSQLNGMSDNNAYVDLLGADFARTAVVRRRTSASVIVSVGALVAGHVLVVPNRHYLNVLSMPDDELSDLSDLATTTYLELRSRYGDSVVGFEHGSLDRWKSSGACLDHAHLHLLPMPVDVLPSVDGFPEKWTSAPHGQVLTVVAALAEQDTGYLTLWDGRRWWVRSGRVRSQELRRSLAEALGEPDRWDWAVFPNTDRMQQTVAGFHRDTPPTPPSGRLTGLLNFDAAERILQ